MAEIPTNTSAEESVLGAIMTRPEIFDRVQAWIINPDAFWTLKHRKIWKAALELNREGIKTDLVSLQDKCKRKYGDEIPVEFLLELQKKFMGSSDVDNHAAIVWENHLRRVVGKIAKDMQEAAGTKDSKIDGLLNKHQKYMEEITNLQPHKDRSIGKVVDEAGKTIKEGGNIVKFGLPFLDHSAGGMTRGELTVLGGRPGHGKTTLMLNVVKSLIEQGLKVLLFNREMTNTETVKKLIVMESKWLKLRELRSATLEPIIINEVDKGLKSIKDKYQNLKMYDDLRDLDESIREIRRFEPDVFIDDYIQLTRTNNAGKRDRRFEIEDIMQDYKWIAKKTKSSGLLISQLNREVEKRIDPSPVMGDYAEGGTIEQLAENCYFVFYGYNFDHNEYSPVQNEIIVKKARYGIIGSYLTRFDGDKCMFGAWEK